MFHALDVLSRLPGNPTAKVIIFFESTKQFQLKSVIEKNILLTVFNVKNLVILD